jgi:hypothetical protein
VLCGFFGAVRLCWWSPNLGSPEESMTVPLDVVIVTSESVRSGAATLLLGLLLLTPANGGASGSSLG